MINWLVKIAFYVVLFSFVMWYWEESDNTTRTGLFYFLFLVSFGQNAYYSHKLSKLQENKK
ncbi:hypothetical protein C9J12_22625 [Photobacterium frigidiphilum]|jgi:hypothetical protein|uniref:Uncharacterized protein n=1 Tax=Photobacterium frigidiphilum TaxID=264736 RepID=A0A2T3J9K5_9GAMM|nr:hypothetical protein C9J12_22625 [Photobacterium frigidiphilum]